MNYLWSQLGTRTPYNDGAGKTRLPHVFLCSHGSQVFFNLFARVWLVFSQLPFSAVFQAASSLTPRSR